jgi:hypothetical protein
MNRGKDALAFCLKENDCRGSMWAVEKPRRNIGIIASEWWPGQLTERLRNQKRTLVKKGT